jgi:hypothetical protein
VGLGAPEPLEAMGEFVFLCHTPYVILLAERPVVLRPRALAGAEGLEIAKDRVQALINLETGARASPRAPSRGNVRARARASSLVLRVHVSVPDGYTLRAPRRS